MKSISIAVVCLLLSIAPLCAEETGCRGLAKGQEQLTARKYQAAVKTFEAVVKADPACADAYAGMGEAYLAMGDNEISSNPDLLEKSVDNVKRALTINPRLATARYKLGVAHLALFEKEKAQKELEQLKTMDKRLADDLSARIATYREPGKYRVTGSSGEKGGGVANRLNDGKGSTPGSKKNRFEGTVEIFITSWCPYCRKATSYLTEKGIPFVARDIEADGKAKQRYKELGGRGVPLIVIGAQKIYGFDPRAIDQYTGR